MNVIKGGCNRYMPILKKNNIVNKHKTGIDANNLCPRFFFFPINQKFRRVSGYDWTSSTYVIQLKYSRILKGARDDNYSGSDSVTFQWGVRSLS